MPSWYDERNARVGVNLGVTINHSQYQSIRPGVMIEIDVFEDESVDEVLDKLEDDAIERMQRQVDKLCQNLLN